ncbi:MAG TPA: protein phosphatase 2C domain-containing protein [Jatrophihabitantaceae bacterium]|jgi:hypothetical protein
MNERIAGPIAASGRILRVEVTTACETGSAHRRQQRGSDDAVGWTGAGAVLATVAVADGHSDPRCVRRRLGADFVVAAAAALPPEPLTPSAMADAFISDWRRRVDQHLAGNPLTPADAAADAAWRANARMAYGTTALLCRITQDAVAVVRIGDGDVIAVATDGRARRLVAPEPRSDGSTESISHPDAQRAALSLAIPAAAAPILMLLATDGFDNAYPAEDSMLRAATELAELRRDSGRPIGSDVLNRWAREAADVSGDDATVAAIWIETAATGGMARAR